MSQCRIARGHIIKSPVWLNVVHLGACGCAKGFESADLISHEREGVGDTDIILGPAKILAIGQARMRAGSDAPFFGRANGAEDGSGIASVKSAGNICGSHEFQNGFVMLASFSQIGVEIDDFSHANRACNPARKSAMFFSWASKSSCASARVVNSKPTSSNGCSCAARARSTVITCPILG